MAEHFNLNNDTYLSLGKAIVKQSSEKMRFSCLSFEHKLGEVEK